jgi:choline dehydrogenase-like flavoprotein
MADDRERVEVLVIGAGAAGAAFTWSLSQAGIKVMCLEQGGWVDPKTYPTALDGLIPTSVSPAAK